MLLVRAGALNLFSLVYKGVCLLSELLFGYTTTLPSFSIWYLPNAVLACLLCRINLLAPSPSVYTYIALRHSVVLHFTADEDLAVSLLNLAENSLWHIVSILSAAWNLPGHCFPEVYNWCCQTPLEPCHAGISTDFFPRAKAQLLPLQPCLKAASSVQILSSHTEHQTGMQLLASLHLKQWIPASKSNIFTGI